MQGRAPPLQQHAVSCVHTLLATSFGVRCVRCCASQRGLSSQVAHTAGILGRGHVPRARSLLPGWLDHPNSLQPAWPADGRNAQETLLPVNCPERLLRRWLFLLVWAECRLAIHSATEFYWLQNSEVKSTSEFCSQDICTTRCLVDDAVPACGMVRGDVAAYAALALRPFTGRCVVVPADICLLLMPRPWSQVYHAYAYRSCCVKML